MAFVIDTNVLVVADDLNHEAGPGCVQACAAAITKARRRRIVLDEAGVILKQYRQNLRLGRQTVGANFLQWLLDNLYNPQRCEQVALTPITGDGRGFEEFPDDPDLAAFDRSDRVFVAVAIKSRFRPCVLNATDTDWWCFREALKRHGVIIEFVCPEQMA
jgi:hypothetical protein